VPSHPVINDGFAKWRWRKPFIAIDGRSALESLRHSRCAGTLNGTEHERVAGDQQGMASLRMLIRDMYHGGGETKFKAHIKRIEEAAVDSMQALLMAVWRRKPKDKVLIHSDQGSQFTSIYWASFLRYHNLVHSMSRRGNCHDNAVAESLFNLLKRERIRRRVYRSRDEARQDVFDYIEMFYNPKRKHVRNGMLSPVEFEKRQKI
jgi:transposase InsO family protein